MNMTARRFARCAFAAMVALAVCAGCDRPPPPVNVTPQQTTPPVPPAAESELIQPFNGRDLEGWAGLPGLWSVEDAAITGRTTEDAPLKSNTFLVWTNGRTGSFEFTCEYRIAGNNPKGQANSGIQYRSKVMDNAQLIVAGYQADIDASGTYTGILYEERLRGIMAHRGEKVLWTSTGEKIVEGKIDGAQAIPETLRTNSWNTYRIVAEGKRIQHYVNGILSVDVTDDTLGKFALDGVLALQLHTGPPMTVQFRNMRLKRM
jgi:hypothetical protein